VVHATTNHQPYDTRVFLKECRSLAAAGYDVCLVVPHDTAEVRDGVRIEPLPKPDGRRARMTRTVWHAYRRVLALSPDIVHLHDSELIPIGWLLKARGHRVVLDAHEDRPKQVLSKPWIRPWLRPAVAAATRVMERLAAWGFDRVIAATPSIARTFPPHKTSVVQNFPIEGELVVSDGIPYADRPPEFVFVGGITAIRGAREMVRAMAGVPAELGASLTLAGRFDPPSLEEEVRLEPGWDRVRAVGWRSREQVADLLARAVGGLVLYHPEPNHVDAQPNKLFEYLSAGVPIIASDFPLWRSLVDEARCGLLVDPLDPAAIATALTWLLEHPDEAAEMGERGRAAVAERFNWSHEAAVLIDTYAELMP
jgi:glycosyltransferase involved in cell wall biosynthesis